MQQNKVGEPKLFKHYGHFSLAFLFVFSTLSAETFENFKRTQAESVKEYKDKRDKEFSKYLKAQWKAYKSQNDAPLYEKPKLSKIIPSIPLNIKSAGPKISVAVNDINYTENKYVPLVKEKKDFYLNFYGSDLGFDIPNGILLANYYPQNQKGIKNFFDLASSSEHEELILEILNIKKSMNLNDWGVYLLVVDISNAIFKNHNNSNLLSWFIFNKLGYAVKIGLYDDHVILLHHSEKTIYSAQNYLLGKKKYYMFSYNDKSSIGHIYTYKQNYPGSDKPLDFSMKTLPLFNLNIKTKILSFTKDEKHYNISYEYNKNLIDFMRTYPQVDYKIFFNAPLQEATYNSIAFSLKKYIDGMKMSDAINFVLNFVQNSFKYERDDKQFTKEKVMFAQETLYYDKSDCEDRVILFSYLAKKLFKIGVVGVKYKDHMATALAIPMQGDSVESGGKRLVIADPTYINASIGQSMAKYKYLIPDSFIKGHLLKP